MRRTLPWSNSPQSWRERLGLGVLVAGIGTSWLLSDRLFATQQAILWCAMMICLGILWQRGWYSLFGPMLFYDLVRTTRRSRFTLYRLYCYCVLILLVLFIVAWFTRTRYEVPTTRDTVSLASNFFYTFMSMQFLAAVMLTPAYTAGAIAGEKERQTIEYLLVTDLRNREIVLSRWTLRLANLLLMVATGLPVMSFVEFGGGVAPELVLVGFAATAITMASLASLSILCSVYARKSRTAILYTYLIVAVYLMLAWGCRLLYATKVATFAWQVAGIQFSVVSLLDLFVAGNPLAHVLDLAYGTLVGSRLGSSLLWRLQDYAGFHVLVCLVCLAWAGARLRAVHLKQVGNVSSAKALRRFRALRPRLGIWPPVLWKELWIEGGLRFRLFGRVLLWMIVISSFLPLVYIYTSAPRFG